MKKITLIMPLEMDGKTFNEGETVEVPDHVYDYLQFAYQEQRMAAMRAQEEQNAEDELQKMLAKHSRSKK